MKLSIEQRDRGHIPIGAFLMLPLFALPFGSWLVETNAIDLGTCAVKSLLSIPCLTCGATRATTQLMDGDLVGAVSYQPLVVGVYAFLFVWGMTSLVLFAADKRARIRLSEAQKIAFKFGLVALPLVNWAYLYFAGI